MIELLIGAAAGAALTFAATRFTKGSAPLSAQGDFAMIEQAFQDLATNIEALPAKIKGSVQAELDNANAEIAKVQTSLQSQLDDANAKIKELEQNGADNLAVVQKAVSDAGA